MERGHAYVSDRVRGVRVWAGGEPERGAAPGRGALLGDAGAGGAVALVPRARHGDDRDEGGAPHVPRAAGAPRRPAAQRRLPAARRLRAPRRQEIPICFPQVAVLTRRYELCVRMLYRTKVISCVLSIRLVQVGWWRARRTRYLRRGSTCTPTLRLQALTGCVSSSPSTNSSSPTTSLTTMDM